MVLQHYRLQVWVLFGFGFFFFFEGDGFISFFIKINRTMMSVFQVVWSFFVVGGFFVYTSPYRFFHTFSSVQFSKQFQILHHVLLRIFMANAFRSHKQSCIPNAAVIAQARREPCSPFPILRGTLASFQRIGVQCSTTVEFEWEYLAIQL